MVELRQGRIITLLCVLFISCSAVDGSDDNTTVEPCTNNWNYNVILTLLCVAIFIICILVGVLIYRSRNRICRSCLQRSSYDPIPSTTPSILTEDNLTKGRISNVELWKLVVYSADSKEIDKLREAILQWTRGKLDIFTPENGPLTSNDDREMETRKREYFQSICHWKDTCAPTEQMDTLFEACSQAEMGESVKKLKAFRDKVSEGVSEYDLKHILWQIGKKSSKHITTLLDRLPKSPFNQESSVAKYVDRAYHELQIWTKGNHAINPTVMLSLLSDDLCDEDMYFCTVSEEDKSPLEGDIKLHVCNVSKAHCQKIIRIISTKGKSKLNEETKVDGVIAENETDLFNTYRMIQDWLDEQECSNYEKRITLRKAVEYAKKASTSNEIDLGEIKQLASSKGNAEAAYNLLMKDIKPFAASLGLDESKLSNYKQLSPSSPSTRGTIGLVADVKAIKGKK